MADMECITSCVLFSTGLWSCTTCTTSLVVCQADGIDSHGSELCRVGHETETPQQPQYDMSMFHSMFFFAGEYDGI